MSIPVTSFPHVVDNAAAGSDSDTNPDDSPEDYQPLSADENSDSDLDQLNSDEDHHRDSFSSNHHRLPNGYAHHEAENGVSSINLNDEVREEEDSEVEEEDSEVEEAWESEISRAFREDESRRNAPLAPENATRVMDAMRGVSFAGVPPEWASEVPEDRWINQIRMFSQLSQSRRYGQ